MPGGTFVKLPVAGLAGWQVGFTGQGTRLDYTRVSDQRGSIAACSKLPAFY